MNNLNMSEAKKNALLQMAGKKLGTDPAVLKKQLETGNVDELVKSLDPETASKVNAVLQNPGALETLLNSDQIRGILGGLSKR